jgi:hypothetical protein
LNLEKNTLDNYEKLSEIREKLVGYWYDGGPDCLEIVKTNTRNEFYVSVDYCECGKNMVKAFFENGRLFNKSRNIEVYFIAPNKLEALYEYSSPNNGFTHKNVFERTERLYW